MSNDVIFEGENRDNKVGNIRIVPGEPTGMLAWLIKRKIVKNGKQAEMLLLGVAIVAVILAIFFFVLSIQHPVPKSTFVSGENALTPNQ